MFAVSFDCRDRHIEAADALESYRNQPLQFALAYISPLSHIVLLSTLHLFSSDRVVDDLNPVLTFTRREVDSLLHFVEEEPDPSQVQLQPQDSLESILRKALHLYPRLITKVYEQRRPMLPIGVKKVGHVGMFLSASLSPSVVLTDRSLLVQ